MRQIAATKFCRSDDDFHMSHEAICCSNLSRRCLAAICCIVCLGLNCALALASAENFDRHVTELVTVKIIFDKNSISVRISSSRMCGADCWLVSESETENILASDSSSESPRPPFVAGKHSSRLWLGSKYSTP